MYKDLIMRLREAPSNWPDAELHYEAADAIEELCNLCYDLNKINSDAITKYLALWEKQQL